MTEFCCFDWDASHRISLCSDCCLPRQSDHHWQYRYWQCSYFSHCLTNTCLLITQSNSRFGFISRTSWKWMWIGGANRPAAFRVAWSAITKNCREIMSRCAYNVAQVRFLPRCMECNAVLTMRFLSVCLSVRPSVCQTRALWQNGRKICPDFYTMRKTTLSTFIRRRMVGGGQPLLSEILG